MASPKLIDVYSLPVASNVCNQTLREVISLPKVSMAHVIMDPENVSLWHRHSKMTEIYFILDGMGILFYDDKTMLAEKDVYLSLPPITPHKLRNASSSGKKLEHLVFAIPPFDPEDVEILDDSSAKFSIPRKFSYEKPPIMALDGALIHELIPEEERKRLDVGLAVGYLPQGRKANPHLHRKSEELYYVASGIGRVMVGEEQFDVKGGAVVYIPTNSIHALENKSETEELKVLCVTSPAYTEGDFIFCLGRSSR